MSKRKRLQPDEVATALQGLPGWDIQDGKLKREYRFPDFSVAFGFMAAAATVAEKMDHHPDWTNVYSRVIVTLWTHSEGGLTALDFELAKRMEELASRWLA